MWKIYLLSNCLGLLNKKKKQISPQNPFKANGYLVNTKSHVIHSLHNSWSTWSVYEGHLNVRWMGVCVCVCAFCTCVSASVCALQGNEFGRLSVTVGGLVPGPRGGDGGWWVGLGEEEEEGELRRSERSYSHCLSLPSPGARTLGWPGCTCAAWPRPRSPANRCTCRIPPCWCSARSDTRAPCRWCPHTRLCLQEERRHRGSVCKRGFTAGTAACGTSAAERRDGCCTAEVTQIRDFLSAVLPFFFISSLPFCFAASLSLFYSLLSHTTPFPPPSISSFLFSFSTYLCSLPPSLSLCLPSRFAFSWILMLVLNLGGGSWKNNLSSGFIKQLFWSCLPYLTTFIWGWTWNKPKKKKDWISNSIESAQKIESWTSIIYRASRK